jgi:hypothetical protein
MLVVILCACVLCMKNFPQKPEFEGLQAPAMQSERKGEISRLCRYGSLA